MGSVASEGIATSPLLRRMNAERVVAELRRGGPMTANDLMAATGMSRPTVHAVCAHLIAGGWVVERAALRPENGPRVGRPSRRYDFDPRAGHALGIDLGAHTVRVVLADLRGTPLAEHTAAFRHAAVPAADRLAATRAAVRQVLDAAGVAPADVLAAALAAPGPVDHGRVVARDAYLPGLSRHDLPAELGAGLGGPVLVENDANLAVLAERWAGPAAGVDDVVVLLAGERLGSGIFLGGRLVRGTAGSAGELELLKLVDGVGDTDAIGRLAGRWGAEAVAERAARQGVSGPPGPDGTPQQAGSLWARCGGDPAAVRAELVFAAVRSGDPVAAAIRDRVVERLARVLAVLATLLNPQLIVISGAVAGSGDVWLAPLHDRLRELTPYPPRLAVGALGDRSVVTGAVRLALDHIETHLLDRAPF